MGQRRNLSPFILGAAVLVLAACDDFATPAELSKPQILAIRAEPPGIPAGGTSELQILVADASGAIGAPEVRWEVTPARTGDPILGSVEPVAAGTAMYRAPASVEEDPTVAAVSATVTAGENELVGIKAVIIGSVPLANPTLVSMAADGAGILDAGRLTLTPGQIVELEVETEPAISDTSTFAWYCTAGEIERYLSNPTELVAQEEPGSGWLIAVVRDGRGGVVWQAIEITVTGAPAAGGSVAERRAAARTVDEAQ